MKRKFKKIALTCAVTALSLATCGLIGIHTASATGAEDITDTTYREANFTFDGYSVRVPQGENDEHGYGVRFFIRMTQALWDKLPEGFETGTLFLPDSLIGDDGLTIDDATAQDCPTTDQWYDVTDEGVAYKESVVYCYDIPEANHGSDIAVRGYVKVGDEYYYSAASDSHSMSWAALQEYNNTASSLYKNEALKTGYLDCTVTLDGEEYATVLYGDKITEPTVGIGSDEEAYLVGVTYSGCYNMANNAKWDFENDVVVGDVKLQTFGKDLTNGELEDFSAYDSYTNARTNSKTAGQDRQWHASVTDSNGVTKYGVASTLNAEDATYYNYFATVSATEASLQYYLGATAENWYYESAMIMIEGTGTITAAFYTGSQVIQRGVWTEINLYKSQLDAASNSGGSAEWHRALTEATTQGRYLFHLGNGHTENIRVYFDEIKMQKGVAITATAADGGSLVVNSEITVTGDYNGNGTDLNAEAFQSVTYTYAVKDPSGNDVTVSADGKFTPTVSGEYKVTVTATVVDNGQSETVSSTEMVTIAQDANVVINAFDTESDAANCGWKSSQENEITWHESYQGKTGVLQMLGKKNDTYRNFYFDASSAWTKTTLNTYITENDTANWDNVTVDLWIVGEEGTKVKIYMDGYSIDIDVGKWVQFVIPKTYFTDSTSAHKNLADIAGDFTDSNEYLFGITTSDSTDATNITVYVDRISFGKSA